MIIEKDGKFFVEIWGTGRNAPGVKPMLDFYQEKYGIRLSIIDNSWHKIMSPVNSEDSHGIWLVEIPDEVNAFLFNNLFGKDGI
jgi:hypothetical protein